MKTVRTVEDLREAVSEARALGRSVGFVPTMGALHAGHRSLVEKARCENDCVVVSVFVNPTQFNDASDLANYPRTEEADSAMLEAVGVDIVFMPGVEDVYGVKVERETFDLGPVATVMEGAMRPGHFDGVAQIVSRLFGWVKPDKAYFGKKDAQQIAVIRRMCRLAGFDDITIVPCPIVREPDGLAMSSRNVRLSADMRAKAPEIHRLLEASVAMKDKGASVADVARFVTDSLNSLPDVKVEYYTVVDADTMMPVTEWTDTPRAMGCVAVWFGDVRLIDNIEY